jgi:hypothetical protein
MLLQFEQRVAFHTSICRRRSSYLPPAISVSVDQDDVGLRHGRVLTPPVGLRHPLTRSGDDAVNGRTIKQHRDICCGDGLAE